jgi:hypothetical protein
VGGHFPDWLLDATAPRRASLVQVVCESYVRGVSTRRIEGLVQTLGIERISKCKRDDGRRPRAGRWTSLDEAALQAGHLAHTPTRTTRRTPAGLGSNAPPALRSGSPSVAARASPRCSRRVPVEYGGTLVEETDRRNP